MSVDTVSVDTVVRAEAEVPLRATTRLRRLLDTGLVVAAGCYDPLTARLAEIAGFQAVHLTGLGVAISQLGVPDLGLTTLSELVDHAARMTSAVDIPVLADVDTGFGGPLNVRRTIRAMERAGVAGVHIEDQADPKHCPLVAGRSVVDRGQALDRLNAALDARTDRDFVIVARTDADTISFAEVVERSNLYLEAGADMVMPILLQVDGTPIGAYPPEEQMRWLRRLVAEIDGPVMGMGDAPPAGYTTADLATAGYAFTMFAADALGAAAQAAADVFEEILRTGTVATRPGRYNDPLALMQAVHLADYTDLERRYTTSSQEDR